MAMGALSAISLIKKLKDLRKINGGTLDGRKIPSARGGVKLSPPNIEINARFKLDGVKHTVEAKRTIVGEKASIKIDGEAMDNPDIDIKARVGTRIRVIYILEYEKDGEDHDLRLRAISDFGDVV